jgi:vacuolar-type H+-ATPase subunit I/STV1
MNNNKGVFKSKYGITDDNYKELLKHLTTNDNVVTPTVIQKTPQNALLINIVNKFNGNTAALYNYIKNKDPKKVKNSIPFLTTISGPKRIAAQKAINAYIEFEKVGKNAEKEYANLKSLVTENNELNRQKQVIRKRFNEFKKPKELNELVKSVSKLFTKIPVSFIEGVKRNRLEQIKKERQEARRLAEVEESNRQVRINKYRKNQAATAIQAATRGFLARKQIKKNKQARLTKAATKIQAVARGGLVREKFRKIKNNLKGKTPR